MTKKIFKIIINVKYLLICWRKKNIGEIIKFLLYILLENSFREAKQVLEVEIFKKKKKRIK